MLKKDREQTTSVDRYPWLSADDERRNMTDREILEKYIDLGTSCLNKEERLKVMDVLYKYKEAFSLRDEIGTCPNIEVEIEVMDKSPFFVRPYHVREEDKMVIDKEMKRLCYMGILKKGFLAYSSLVMLISRKLWNNRQDSRERYRKERYSNHNNRNRNRSGERAFVRNYRRDRSSSNDRSRSGSRASTNRDRIRCYICREYDHFARDCPNSREERDLEQLQHMLNMEEQDCRSLSAHSSDEDCRSPLNL